MFWENPHLSSENIEALLNKEDCRLKDLLEDEDILQECKTQNTKLVKFLNRPDIVEELVSLITTEPPADLDENLRFFYPNVACEILTSDMPSLKSRMVEEPAIMNKLFGFFEQKTQLNPLLASFICKTFSTLIIKKIEQDWFLYQTICLHVLEFIKTKENFLECMVHHFSTPVVMDLLLTMLNEVEDAKMKSNFLEWINENGLIERMIDVLRSPDEPEKHTIVAQFLIELIKTGRCNRQNDTEDRKNLRNPLLQRLEEPQTTTRLIDAILCETRTESGILSGLQVLLCLLENSIIQEPVSQTALQQIIDAEKEHHDEIVKALMSIIQPRVHDLFELLLNPPMKTSNYALTSLGNVRLQLCNLFSVLLETENSSIIEEICKTNFFVELLNLFKQYCWNNFLHNYVKRCLSYGVQAFDTIPNDTKLVISALQKHIVVDCSVANKLMDCWNANTKSLEQEKGARRLGYMGHLIEILSAISSAMSASEEFRALIMNSLIAPVDEGVGSEEQNDIVEKWNQIMIACEGELELQKRLLANCDPNDRLDDLTGFPSNPDEPENDTEDFSYHYNASMHSAVNSMMNDFNDYNDDDIESRNKFEEACSQNASAISFDTNFDNWDQQQFFNSALNLKSSRFDPDNEQDNDDSFRSKDIFATTDPFESSSSLEAGDAGGFNAIMDNFADFDSHFANMTPASFTPADFESTVKGTGEFDPPCFVATTQVLEISSVPPIQQESQQDQQMPPQEGSSPIKFQLGPNPTPIDAKMEPATTLNNIIKSFDELDDEEFFSLRDDSNEMSSLTDDNDKKFTFENTEVPEDDDDDFASADESSSKGNSEEETNEGVDQFVDCIISTTDEFKSNEDQHNEKKLNGTDNVEEEKRDEVKDELKSNGANETSKIPSTNNNNLDKLAQTPDDENPTPVVPLENGSA